MEADGGQDDSGDAMNSWKPSERAVRVLGSELLQSCRRREQSQTTSSLFCSPQLLPVQPAARLVEDGEPSQVPAEPSLWRDLVPGPAEEHQVTRPFDGSSLVFGVKLFSIAL